MKKIKQLFKMFIVFLKVGSFTFGGGLAMIPIIQKEVVDKQKWIKEEEILDIFAISQSIPGVISINSAIFIGKRVMGISGAIAAALGLILPAFFSILLIVILLTNINNNVYIDNAFSGIRSASAALILLAAIKLGKSSLKNKAGYAIAIISFLAIVVFDINAIWVIIASGVCGYFLFRQTGRDS